MKPASGLAAVHALCTLLCLMHVSLSAVTHTTQARATQGTMLPSCQGLGAFAALHDSLASGMVQNL